MPSAEIKEIIPASAVEVFDLLHNYEKRLEWDTLLQKAYLEDEFSEAGKDAISVCQGKGFLGGFALRTQYVSFERGKVAAVKMLNEPPFFDSFAASIRHLSLSPDRSEIIYKVHFTAKPKFLRWLLNPLMRAILAWETKKRLVGLKGYFEKNSLKAG